MRAIIFIPSDLSLDSLYAQECMSYVLDRGYQLAAIFRDWTDVHACLLVGNAQIVVVARAEHCGELPAEDANVRTRAIPNRAPAVGRCPVHPSRNDPDRYMVKVYRAGYADGYVDCLTLRQDPPPELS